MVFLSALLFLALSLPAWAAAPVAGNGWGFPMAAYAFFSTLAFGSTLTAAMCRVYGLTGMAPFFRRAVWLAMVAGLLSFALLAWVVAAPWRLLVYSAITPNPTANFWWLVVLTGMMLGCLFLLVALLGSGNGHADTVGQHVFLFAAAVAGFGANNNLAGLLAGMVDPPLWSGVQALVLFCASTILAGCSLAVLACLAVRAGTGGRLAADERAAVQTAGVVMLFMLVVLAGVTAFRLSAVLRSPGDPGHAAVAVLFSGPLRWSFWGGEVVAGLLVPLACLLTVREGREGRVGAAAGLALLGLLFQRYHLVLLARLTPSLGPWQPPAGDHLVPSLPQVAVLALALAVLSLSVVLAEQGAAREEMSPAGGHDRSGE